MKKRPKITEWLSSPKKKPDKTASVQTTALAYDNMLQSVRSNIPGQWSSNLIELSRHFTSAAFLAISTLCNQASGADVRCMERTPDPDDGDEELPWGDSLCELVRNPNDEDTFSDILYQTSQQLSMTGIALVWMPFSNLNFPTELYVLPSASATPLPPSPMYPNGSYQIQPYWFNGWYTTVPSYQSAAGARIPAEQIIRVKNHHPYLRYDGYAVLTAIRRQVDTVDGIDLARYAQQYSGADPSLALEFDPTKFDPGSEDLQGIRERFKNLYAGPLGEKIMPLPPGVTAKAIGTSPSEMAWCEGWSQLVDFVLASYGVPKSVAGLQDDVSYATLYASLKQFNILSLGPLLKKISDKFNKQLVTPYFGNDLYLKVEPQKITDDDLLEKQLTLDGQLGIRRLNEWRKLRDLPPVDGEEGERWVMPSRDTEKEEVHEPNESDDMVGSPEARQMDRTRPVNRQAGGAMGEQPDRFKPVKRLAEVLEKYKTTGLINQI